MLRALDIPTAKSSDGPIYGDINLRSAQSIFVIDTHVVFRIDLPRRITPARDIRPSSRKPEYRGSVPIAPVSVPEMVPTVREEEEDVADITPRCAIE